MKMPAFISVTGLAFVVLTTHVASVAAQSSANYALSFDGIDDLVIVPGNPALELTDGTLELWFKPDWSPGSISYDPILVANRQGAALTRYSLHVNRNLAGIALANGSSTSTVPYSFTRGQWYHLALSESASTAQVYVNGRFVGSTTNGFGTLIGLPLHLGSDGTGQFFRGQMDEVRIWSVARNGSEIQFNVARALAGTESGLVAYWRLNEGAGMIAVDARTNLFNGTVVGPVWTNSDVTLVNTAGSLGMALDLTASRGTYVQVPTAPSMALSNQLTFEAWVKPRGAQCSTILSRGNGANLATTDYIFQVGTDGTNCGVMKLALMVAGEWAASESLVPTNVWTHVAATYDGTNKQFYINGVPDRSVPATGAVYTSASQFFIGRQGFLGSNYFDGTLDEVRVWNTVRGATDIRTNVNRAVPVNAAGLVGYWRFDEPAGIGAFDTSARSGVGTLVNRPVRVPSFWTPVITMNGASLVAQECRVTFSDAGVAVHGAPVSLGASHDHTLMLRSDGMVRAWGRNDRGQTNVPGSATNVISVAASYTHSVALTANGRVIAWGASGGSPETNVPTQATNIVMIAAGTQRTLVLKADGSALAWGYGPTNLPAAANGLVAISASVAGNHDLGIKADGSIVGWGDNSSGQINIPGNAFGAIALAAGSVHSLALKPNGTLVAWGNNASGQLNIPASAFNVVAIAAGSEHNLALRADGSVIAWGRNDYGQATVPISATGIVSIAAAGVHSLALRSDGTILGWGYNDYGVISIPGDVSRLSLPVTSRGLANPDTPSTYILSYTVTNAAGAVATATRTVIVTDTRAPVLTLSGANPFNLDVGASFADPGATAIDLCEGTLTANIVQTGAVTTAVPGSYTLAYAVSDSSGYTATTNRTVLVRGWPTVLGFNAFFSGTNAVSGSPVIQFVADVNPNGLPTIAFAQYGLGTNYPGRTASVNLSASYNVSSFFATLEGMIPGATYHFRIAASNSLGVIYGPDQTFTVPTLFAAGDINGDGRVDQAELNTVLSNYWPHSEWLQMTNPATLGRGLFQFALTNASGWNFSVLESTNLIDWNPLSAPAYPVWQFRDSAATNQPQRFYRLSWP